MMPLPPPARPAEWRAPIRVGATAQQSKLLRKVEPMYPELARQARISAPVILQVKLDEHGNVTEARVLRGHPLLNDAAMQAVRRWKYSPTLLNGAPVSIVTTVAMTFHSDRTAKLDPAVALAISRFKTGGPSDPAEKEFVRDVWAELELTVEGSADEPAAELERRGFEIVSWDKPHATVIGRIQVPKLESLIVLKSVRFIAPHRRKS